MQTNDKTIDKSQISEKLAELRREVIAGNFHLDDLNNFASNCIDNSVEPTMAMELARLAQVAGNFEVSITMLTYVENKYPEIDEAWKEHWEILSTLGEDVEKLKLKAKIKLARPDLINTLSDATSGHEGKLEESGIDLETPFVKAEREESLLRFYLNLFEGREDCFARQWVDRETKTAGYVPIRRPLTPSDLREHLMGRKSYGIYLLLSNGLTKLGVLDADLKHKEGQEVGTNLSSPQVQNEVTYMLERINSHAKELGLNTLVEFSGGKGYHVWFPFVTPVDPARVRQTLKEIAENVKKDLSYFSIEVYPKQDKLSGKGLGNLVKLPLGVHLSTGKRSYFIPKVEGDVWNQIEAIMNFQPNDPTCLKQVIETEQSNNKIYLHPRQFDWISEYPELKILLERCPALGMIITSCRMNRGLSLKEEKVLFGTLSFLKRGRLILHELLNGVIDFNPSAIDYKLSLVKGSPLGCKRIHSLLNLQYDYCDFAVQGPYAHPLLHCEEYCPKDYFHASEKIEGLEAALEQLLIGIKAVIQYLPKDIRSIDQRVHQSNLKA